MTRALELAARPVIYNVTLSSANTEFSRALPAGIRKFSIQCRTTSVDIKLSFVEGESGSTFLTILGNSAYNEDLIHAPIGYTLTLYMQTTSTASPVVEIVAWSIDPTGGDL
jgi:hypothetical protein